MLVKDNLHTPRSSLAFPSSVMLHTTALRQHLPDGISLKRAFDRDSLRSMLGSEPAQSSLLSEIMAILLGAGDISRAGLRQRLVSPSATVKGTSIGAGGSRTPSQLHVEFGNAARILRAQLLRNVVEAQFGISGSRIMALLRDMGKLEEKHVSEGGQKRDDRRPSHSSTASRSPR